MIPIKKDTVVKLGDFVLERNRFDKQDYVVYEISYVDGDYCKLLITHATSSNMWAKCEGREIGGDMRCFYNDSRTSTLNYLMPTGKLLYGQD